MTGLAKKKKKSPETKDNQLGHHNNLVSLQLEIEISTGYFSSYATITNISESKLCFWAVKVICTFICMCYVYVLIYAHFFYSNGILLIQVEEVAVVLFFFNLVLHESSGTSVFLTIYSVYATTEEGYSLFFFSTSSSFNL